VKRKNHIHGIFGTARRLAACAVSAGMIGMLTPAALLAAEPAASADGKAVTVAYSPKKAADVLAENSETEADEIHDTIKIDTETGTVTENGTRTDLKEALDMSAKTEEKLTSGNETQNTEKITDYLNRQGIYQVRQTDAGTLQVDAPYQMQRIIVSLRRPLTDSFGASYVMYYQTAGQYVLSYRSEQATRAAFEKLVKQYGSDCVMLDTAVRLSESGQTSGSGTGTKTASVQTASASGTAPQLLKGDYVSWATHQSGLDTLKEYANANKKLGKVKVAVIDTGIMKQHELFEGRTISRQSTAMVMDQDDVSGLKYSYQDVDRVSGHGTHVAGILADATSDQVQLLIIRAFTADATGEPYASLYDLAMSVEYAKESGASVVNISAGINHIPGRRSDYASKALYEAQKEMYRYMESVLKSAYRDGVVVCCASGNRESASDSLIISKQQSYPAYSPYVLAVGAITKKRKRANFSYYGKELDFVAGGYNILSASRHAEDEYVYNSGTSMAVPIISAAAAMVRLYHPGYSRGSVVKVLRQHAYYGKNGDRTVKQGYGYVKISSPSQTSLKKKQSIRGVKKSYKLVSKGKNIKLKAKSSSGLKVTYHTGNASVASVSSKGTVKPRKKGKTTITIKVPNNSRYDYAVKKVTVTVRAKK
jgi:hypothetical protein